MSPLEEFQMWTLIEKSKGRQKLIQSQMLTQSQKLIQSQTKAKEKVLRLWKHLMLPLD